MGRGKIVAPGQGKRFILLLLLLLLLPRPLNCSRKAVQLSIHRPGKKGGGDSPTPTKEFLQDPFFAKEKNIILFWGEKCAPEWKRWRFSLPLPLQKNRWKKHFLASKPDLPSALLEIGSYKSSSTLDYIFFIPWVRRRERERMRETRPPTKPCERKVFFLTFLLTWRRRKKCYIFFSLSHFTAFLKGFFFGWSSFGRKKKETSFAEWSTIVFSFDLPDSHRNPNLFLHHSPFKCVLTRKKILLGVSASRQEWQLFPHVEILARILSYFLWHPVSSLCVANTTSRSPLPAPLSPPPPPPLPLHLLPIFLFASRIPFCVPRWHLVK